jgi:hypothetical protein
LAPKSTVACVAWTDTVDRRRICFLGFGFWKENVDLLGLDVRDKKVFASCYDLPRGTKRDVLYCFGTTSDDKPTINFGREDQDVMKFLTHWHVLS